MRGVRLLCLTLDDVVIFSGEISMADWSERDPDCGDVMSMNHMQFVNVGCFRQYSLQQMLQYWS